MTETNPSILSHVSIGTNDFSKAVEFYDQILPTLGIQSILQFPGAKAYGKKYPEFWVQVPLNQKPASVGNGFHVGFLAQSKKEVDAFHQAALQAGAVSEGEPGPRELYGPAYYGCFVRDLDGNKIEAMFWDEKLA